ncbi:hypothetical protein BJ878DRAFT_524976 [Calycina marina]|uniref:Uncharacterized protein n=1 Tax=Calycina marina TaxID=1763456 RepID=A0A9P7YWS2_9HELO|nr:hypothetical protein BJ878DRAFT_524976 [Calycina marina]
MKSTFAIALAVISVVGAQYSYNSPSSGSNLTTTIHLTSTVLETKTASPTDAPVCCFVFQDTATELWAQIFTTSTYVATVNITSYTVRVTPGPSTTETNIETNIYTTVANFTTPISVGENPISLFSNIAPGPAQSTSLYNASKLVTHGVTVASPQAVYIYSSVTIVTVPPVTDAEGNFVCGTTYIKTDDVDIGPSTTRTVPYTDTPDAGYTPLIVNSNAQAYYYGVTNLLTETTMYGAAVIRTSVIKNTVASTTFTRVETSTPASVFLINSQLESVSVPTTRPSGVVVTLPTPFVYQPTSGAYGHTREGVSNCYYGDGTEGYGYPPQTLLDFMAKEPVITAQYAGFASCLAGGPSMVSSKMCTAVAPAYELAGGDLTESTILTVTPSQPAPTAVAEITPHDPALTVAPLPPSASSTSPSSQPAPTTLPAQSASPSPAPHPQSPSPNPPAQSPNQNPAPASSSPQSPAAPAPPQSSSSVSPSAANATPPKSPPPELPSSQSADAENINPQVPENPSPAQPGGASASFAAEIASAIANAVGATQFLPVEVVSGTTDVVLIGQATMTVNPAAPIAGMTTIISGVTNVIVSSAATLPLSQVVQALSGHTTLVDETLEVVIQPTTIPFDSQLPGLTGTSITISGASLMVVSQETTASVVVGMSTSSSTPSSSSASEAPEQFISLASTDRDVTPWLILLGTFALAIVHI